MRRNALVLRARAALVWHARYSNRAAFRLFLGLSAVFFFWRMFP